MNTSIGELAEAVADEQQGLSRSEPDRTVLRLMHTVRLWLGRVLS
jgi:hypothetical protein